MISPPRICAVPLTVEFRKFPEAVQPRRGVRENDDWEGKRREGVLTKRVTIKYYSVKLTEFMLVAAVLAVASTSYVAQYFKVLWLFEKRGEVNKRWYFEFAYGFTTKDIVQFNGKYHNLLFILKIFNEYIQWQILWNTKTCDTWF